MMWADRAGLGTCALIVIFFGVLYGVGMLNRFDPPTATFAPVEQHTSATEKKLYTDAEVGIKPKDDLSDLYEAFKDGAKANPEVGDATLFDVVKYIYRGVLLVALPLWLTLRIADFVFGGPRRRVERRAARSN